jgi:hypothetical protein
MTNYNKSFNFRNGVQVDDTNFIVNTNGLVGIGTSIPTEVLDVKGNAKISGFATASTLYAPTLDIAQLGKFNKVLNVGVVSITSGIVTAFGGSGIVTYYGDGGKLRNLPTSQWVDVDPGFGYTSIYAAGNVGVGTTFPLDSFQVGGNPRYGTNGIGFNSTGSINASGIITAYSFVGFGTDLKNLNASNFTTGTLDNQRLPQNINISGIITANSFVGSSSLTIGDILSSGNVIISGVSSSSNLFASNSVGIGSTFTSSSLLPYQLTITAPGANPTSGLSYCIVDVSSNQNGYSQFNLRNTNTGYNASGDLVITCDNGTDSSNYIDLGINNSLFQSASWTINGPSDGYLYTSDGSLSIGIGTTTASKYLSFFAGGVLAANEKIRVSNSGVGIGTTNSQNILQVGTGITFSNSSINLTGIVTANSFVGNITGNVTGNITGTASSAYNIIGSPSILATNIISGVSTLGVSSATTLYIEQTLGIGTLSPNADIHIVKNSSAKIQITSNNTNESYISIGTTVNRSGDNGEIRYGNTNLVYAYSNRKSLDIINYSIGNINQYLNFGSSGLGTGNFNWIYGPGTSNLMSLTYGGYLGIGVTNPSRSLHVVGTSTITSDSYVGGSFNVLGNTQLSGDTTILGTLNVNNISGTFTGNVNSTSGLSTFNAIKSTDYVQVQNRLGIGTLPDVLTPFQINSGVRGFVVGQNGSVGIKTTKVLDSVALDVLSGVGSFSGIAIFQGVGIGSTNPRSAVDFADAGTPDASVAGVPGANYSRFMIPPKISTSIRVGLSTVEGALIYNTTSKRLELYIGTAWVGIATIA